jgi:hypothetical protein
MSKRTGPAAETRVERSARLRWVPISQMRVNPTVQRDLNHQRVAYLAANFDPEQIGSPTVNARDGVFFIIDGQHRVAAMKLMGWADQSLQCWTYEGLTEREEAEAFLKINDTLSVKALDRFRSGVAAGRETECDIDRIVRALGLSVSSSRTPGSIAAVAALQRVYARSGPAVLSRALRVIRDAYGDAGLEGPVIDGMGMLCQRYQGQVTETTLVDRLAGAHGGVGGLLNKAEVTRRATGRSRAECVASAAVEIVNRGRGGQKLPDWWKA